MSRKGWYDPAVLAALVLRGQEASWPLLERLRNLAVRMGGDEPVCVMVPPGLEG